LQKYDQIPNQEINETMPDLKSTRRVSSGTFRIALFGIKFFYEQTMKCTWHTLQLVRPDKESKLPIVISFDEVRELLSCVRHDRYRVCLIRIYACGLHLQEGTQRVVAGG
jgi:site-specific recombinase XerD